MNKIVFPVLILIYLLFTNCEDDFNINFNDNPTIVIEGWVINSDEPQRIIVSESLNKPVLDIYSDYRPQGNLIENAVVILSSTSQPNDTLVHEKYIDDWTGYYITDKIKGIPGETYYLRVEYNDKVYEAEAFMPPVPVLDSISFGRKRVSKENANLFVPLVNFNDPGDEENYYLFREAYAILDSLGQRVGWTVARGGEGWMISLFSDEYINGKHAELNVHEGIFIERYWLNANYFLWPGYEVAIRMQSITKEAYDYYQALINQLNYAAGVFHPAPANPPTNISNGGLGFFGASAVSYASAIVPWENK